VQLLKDGKHRRAAAEASAQQLLADNKHLRAVLVEKDAAYDALLHTHSSEASQSDHRFSAVKQERIAAQAAAQEEARQRHAVTAQLAAAQAHVETLLDDKLCKICSDHPSEWAICQPCGHLVGCLSCAEECRRGQDKCPICREDLRGVQQIYS
jgi:hypothetical protein